MLRSAEVVLERLVEVRADLSWTDPRFSDRISALVTESARAHIYILSKQVQKTCQFWLLTFWLLTVPSLFM